MNKQQARERAHTFFNNLKHAPPKIENLNDDRTSDFWEELYQAFKTRLMLEYYFEGEPRGDW